MTLSATPLDGEEVGGSFSGRCWCDFILLEIFFFQIKPSFTVLIWSCYHPSWISYEPLKPKLRQELEPPHRTLGRTNQQLCWDQGLANNLSGTWSFSEWGFQTLRLHHLLLHCSIAALATEIASSAFGSPGPQLPLRLREARKYTW